MIQNLIKQKLLEQKKIKQANKVFHFVIYAQTISLKSLTE